MPGNWLEPNEVKDLSDFGSSIFGSTDQGPDSSNLLEWLGELGGGKFGEHAQGRETFL